MEWPFFEMGGSGTAMERHIVQWLGNKIGFKQEYDGILTSGGSLANLTALLGARQAIEGSDVWEDGIGNNKFVILVSEQAHYCVDRSSRIMGMGAEGVQLIPCTDDFKMDINELQIIYKKVTDEGKKVLAIVGSACSTSTGAYDDLEEIGSFCSKNKVWFHVDAAHGGGALISDKYKYLLKGIEKADSVVVDFHKLFLTPALCTAVVFKKCSPQL